MWLFKSDPRKQDSERLDKYLRRQLEEAANDFDKRQPSRFAQVFARKRKSNPIDFRPIALGGFNHALRAVVAPSASPETIVYSTAANVAIDMFSGYYRNIEASGVKDSPTAKLSLHLISGERIPDKLKDNVARMRHCIQKLILSTAEYIEMGDFASLEEVIREADDSGKRLKVTSLVDSQYRLHVSYRSLAISLQLFAAINQELLRRIESQKTTNPERAHTFLITNAVFVYEIADLIICFLQAFELQGIPELRELHDQALSEIDRGQTQINDIRTRIEDRANSGSGTILNIQNERRSLDDRSAAIEAVQTVWSQLMEKIDDAQNGARTFRDYIADFDIIKRNAELNLTILNLMTVTKMVQQNVEKMQQMMLEVDKLRLPAITAEDVRRFFNLSSNPASKSLISTGVARN